MAYDIEALRQKYNVAPPVTPVDNSASSNQAGGYDVNALRQKYNVTAPNVTTDPSAPTKPFKYDVVAPVDTRTSQEKIDQYNKEQVGYDATAKKANSPLGILFNTGKEIVKSIASSEVGLGHTIAKVGSQDQLDQYTKSISDLSNAQTILQKLIKERDAKGIDTTALKHSYNSNQDLIGEHQAAIDEYNKNLPSNAKALGQIGGIGLDLATGGTYGTAAKTMETAKLAKGGIPFLKKAATAVSPELGKIAEITTEPTKLLSKKGAIKAAEATGVGYAQDVTQGMQGNRGEDRTGANALIPGAGTALGAGLSLGMGATAKLAERKANVASHASEQVDKLAGLISQGKKEELPAVIRSLGDIDTTHVKTHQDLVDELNHQIEGLSTKLDSGLDAVKGTKKIDELTQTVSSGNQNVKINHVDEALGQLEDLYTKTRDAKNLAEIRALREKATNEGLSVKEINDIAKKHGMDLSGFNANGEAASGLNKQAAENTRKGLKTTARGLFGNKVYQETDKKISELISTRDLVQKNVDAAQKLNNKIKERGLGERIGRRAGQVLNIIGLNSPKGFVEYFLGRGTGLKTLNALDLEAMLNKNLSKLQNLIEKSGNVSDRDLIKELENLSASEASGTNKGLGNLMNKN